MELVIFARFHARPGQEDVLVRALRDVVPPSRAEPGCLAISAYRSVRDPLLFWIHSRWVDEAAFDRHAELPHTTRFIAEAEKLIDHPLDITRATALA
jgi:quinol monooxygenase YgiN